MDDSFIEVMSGWGGGGVLDRRDVLDLMEGRSRMTINPRILTMPGRSMSGFHRPGGHNGHAIKTTKNGGVGMYRRQISQTRTGMYAAKDVLMQKQLWLFVPSQESRLHRIRLQRATTYCCTDTAVVPRTRRRYYGCVVYE